jgi:cellulose biosynthesis protein BcsQ
MLSVAFFNNKGGVGKTTLSCNMASYLSISLGKKVVFVDCDPQANATQLLLDDDTWEELYEDREASKTKSILKALTNIRAGDSSIDPDVELMDSARFGVKVLAGHPSLSTVEDLLSASWGDFQRGTLGGARRSLWMRSLIKTFDADIVVFDLGPSLGAINRSVLLASDFFVTPVAADLFSLYALENIGEWFDLWIREYQEGIDRLAREQSAEMKRYDVPSHVGVANGYVGYTVQQYVTKTSRGRVRRVAAYDQYKKQIPERAARLDKIKASTVERVDIGIIPNMFSMIPLAQSVHSPISGLSSTDGVRGAQVSQQQRYVSQLTEIFAQMARNMGVN